MPSPEPKKARYADALIHVHAAVLKLSEAQRLNLTEPEKFWLLPQVMDDLSAAFRTVTGSKCRSCVKNHITDKSVPSVQAICRNTDYIGGPEQVYEIADSTDFRIFTRDATRPWFFGNDLPALVAVGTSHNKTPGWADRYKSTLIWPIRHPTSKDIRCISYLCVDSKKLKPFNADFDYPLGAIVSDALAMPLVDIRHYLMSENDEKEELSNGKKKE